MRMLHQRKSPSRIRARAEKNKNQVAFLYLAVPYGVNDKFDEGVVI